MGAETSEFGGSVIAVEDEPLLGGFEEMPSEVTTALHGPVNVTVTTTLTEAVTTAAETTFVTTETSPALTTKPQASARITEDGYKYYITGGFVVIEGYEGESSELVIPSEIDGKPVREIGYSAFSGHEDIKSVQIPESVERIGHNAFSGCKGIISISVPDTVASLGDGAFSGCTSLAEVKLPQGLARIEDDTFSDCKALKNISIPESTERLGKRVFSGCESLSAITITENITTIGDMAFYGCTSLDEIIVPDTVSSLGFAVFADCTGLKSAVLPREITALKSGNGFGMFTGCELLESVTLLEELKSIGYSAFNGCTSLVKAVLPDGITQLKSEKKNSTFKNCSALADVKLPSGLVYIGEDSFRGCVMLKNIDIPERLTVLEAGAFAEDERLGTIQIPDGVVQIGDEAFSGCKSLSKYEIYAVCGDKSSEKVIITYSLTYPTIDKVEINYCTHAPTDTNPYDAEMDITSTFTEGKRPLVYFYPAGGMNFKIHAENSEQIIAMKITSTKGTEKKSLRAVYNKEKDVWETPVNSFFDPSNRNYVPGSLNVSMIKKTPDIIDYAVGDETIIKNNVLDNEILKDLSITPVEKNDNAAMYEIKGSDGKNYDVDCKVFTYQAPSINLSGKTVKPADIAKNPSAYGFKKSGKTVVQNGVTYDLYTKDSSDVKSTKDDDLIAASMKKLDKANEIYNNVIGGKYVASAVANVVVPKKWI